MSVGPQVSGESLHEPSSPDEPTFAIANTRLDTLRVQTSRQLIARGAKGSCSERTCRDIVIEDLDAAALPVRVVLQNREIWIRFA